MTQATREERLVRLDNALAALEAAAARVIAADAARADLVDSLAVMEDDRLRLAMDLDSALARSRSLEIANSAVAERLDRAGAVVSALIGAQAGED